MTPRDKTWTLYGKLRAGVTFRLNEGGMPFAQAIRTMHVLNVGSKGEAWSHFLIRADDDEIQEAKKVTCILPGEEFKSAKAFTVWLDHVGVSVINRGGGHYWVNDTHYRSRDAVLSLFGAKDPETGYWKATRLIYAGMAV